MTRVMDTPRRSRPPRWRRSGARSQGWVCAHSLDAGLEMDVGQSVPQQPSKSRTNRSRAQTPRAVGPRTASPRPQPCRRRRRQCRKSQCKKRIGWLWMRSGRRTDRRRPESTRLGSSWTPSTHRPARGRAGGSARSAPTARASRSSRVESSREGVEVAGSTGLEPAASGVTGRRSNQLNYDPAKPFECNSIRATCSSGSRRPHAAGAARLVGGTGLEPVTTGV